MPWARQVWARYGESPSHLVAVLVGGAISAYAVTRVPSIDVLIAIGLWFGGMLLVHDLVLFPLYAAVDNVAAWVRSLMARPVLVSRVNYVRVPAVLSSLLLLAWFPLVLRLSPTYERDAARSDDAFLRNWLIVTATLFVGSAVLYAKRLRSARRKMPRGLNHPLVTGRAAKRG